MISERANEAIDHLVEVIGKNRHIGGVAMRRPSLDSPWVEVAVHTEEWGTEEYAVWQGFAIQDQGECGSVFKVVDGAVESDPFMPWDRWNLVE